MGRGNKDKPIDARRMLDSKSLGDNSTQRHPNDMRAIELKKVEQFDEIGGEATERNGRALGNRLPDAAIIGKDQ